MFFDDEKSVIGEIRPIHVSQYLEWRNKYAIEKAKEKNPRAKVAITTGQIAANREKALFSHIWNKARLWGYTDLANPCQGIEGFQEKGRDIYVDDAAFKAIWDEADQPLRDALDLALLTGQRPADLLKMSETDIRDGAIWVQQNKTGTKLRISIAGELQLLLERIIARKQAHRVRSLRLLIDKDGTPMVASTLRSKFERARARAGQTWQFRDLRAKAATENDMSGGMDAAQDQLGHTTPSMTAKYVRNRAGKLVKPTR
ncbi:tyrosine-type recombinase/integrase [Chitinimonas arctica]|nr:tyrosine-type recombinase/integrase [Chitinimonas arctica]